MEFMQGAREEVPDEIENLNLQIGRRLFSKVGTKVFRIFV